MFFAISSSFHMFFQGYSIRKKIQTGLISTLDENGMPSDTFFAKLKYCKFFYAAKYVVQTHMVRA